MKRLPAIAIGLSGACAVFSVGAYLTIGTGEIAVTRNAAPAMLISEPTWNSSGEKRQGGDIDARIVGGSENASGHQATGGARTIVQEGMTVSASYAEPGSVRRASIARDEGITADRDSVRVPVVIRNNIFEGRAVVASGRLLTVRSQFGTAAEAAAEPNATESVGARSGREKDTNSATGSILADALAKHSRTAETESAARGISDTPTGGGPTFNPAKANARPSWNQSPLTPEEHLYRAQVGRRAFANEVTEATLNASAQATPR